MGYVTTRRIIDLSTGFNRGPGEPIHPAELEPDRWNPLLAEGAVIDQDAVTDSVDATDGAVKLAAELGYDLNLITGTGKDGRILVADVRAFETVLLALAGADEEE